MRSFTLLSFIFLFGIYANSQTIVSTNPENRNALVEEFTGIACGFCPYGHLEVENLINNNPGDAFGIAIHQGYYAIPDPGQPDYQTAMGDGLGSYFGVNAWPNGLVNRHDFGTGLVTGLEEWSGLASQVLGEEAYVNVACEASIDVQTRELTVHVEAYYTGDSPEASNFLNVALIQNDIKGPQFSSWFNPDGITPDGAYMHQHMLRDLLTGQWGDVISPTSNGTFIDKYYTYTVPEFINDVPVRLGDLAIVSYISEEETEVENVNGCYPVLENFNYTHDAAMFDLILPEASCGYIEGKVIVENHGSADIESINFEIQINDESPVGFVWEEESIASFASKEIYLPAVYFSGMETSDYTIEVTAVNGTTDENSDNNVIDATFEQAEEVALPITLHLTTDNYFGTAWYLYDGQNNVIQQGSGYAYDQTFDIPLDVDAGCYKLEMTDLDGFFFGNYSLEDDNGVFFSQNGNFGNSMVTSFSLPIYEPTADINATTTTACIGGTVQFLDASTGGASEWAWTFEGGDPEISDEKNPIVSYAQPGSYDVTLSVTNSLGTSQVTMEDYITITSLDYGNLALLFDGIDDYVEVTNEEAFDFTTALTLELWMMPASLTGIQGVISKNFGNNAHPYQIRLHDNEILFGFYSNTIGWQPIETYNANLQAGQWYHIACTYDMTVAKIYVNGVQKAQAYKSFEIPQNDQPLEIGRSKDVSYEYFPGIIDEVRVWDIALNQEEIADNMCGNYLNTGNENLIGYFKFNECGGTLLTDSQNGYDGVLIDMEGDEWMESTACPAYTVNFEVTEDPGSISLEDATVNMNGTIRYTDAEGSAEFEGYEKGYYDYVVYKDGYVPVEGSFELLEEDVTIEISIVYTGLETHSMETVSLYPNPVNDMLNITVSDFYHVELLDLSGKIIKTGKLVPGNNAIDLTHQQPGMYFVKIIKGDSIQIDKILVQ